MNSPRDVIERLAAENFVALAVNFFDHPGVPEDIFKRPGAQPDDQVLGDLNAAFAMLRQHPLVGDQPIFAWGYCLGGRFALLWPTFQHELAGAASFHGFPTNDTKNPNTPTQPVERVPFLRDTRDRLLRRSRSPRAVERRRRLSQRARKRTRRISRCTLTQEPITAGPTRKARPIAKKRPKIAGAAVSNFCAAAPPSGRIAPAAGS